MQSLHVRKHFQLLVISHKFLHGQGPEYVTELFTAERSNLRGSGARPQLPLFQSGTDTFIAGILWNSMPNKVSKATCYWLSQS